MQAESELHSWQFANALEHNRQVSEARKYFGRQEVQAKGLALWQVEQAPRH